MVTLSAVAIAFVLGLVAGLWVRRADRTPEGLPCPNLPCTNRLPRRGLWGGTGTYVNEECAVCGATVRYVPHTVNSAQLSPLDCYVRIKAEAAPKENA